MGPGWGAPAIRGRTFGPLNGDSMALPKGAALYGTRRHSQAPARAKKLGGRDDVSRGDPAREAGPRIGSVPGPILPAGAAKPAATRQR
jgi:hypothetical protein